MSANRFVLTEAALSIELGLPQKNLRSVRGAQLTRGQHWQHVANEVRYSAEGRAALLTALNVAEPVKDLAPKKSPEEASPIPPASIPPRPGDVRELVCVRTYPLNHRIVLARLGPQKVRVRLADSRNIIAGMSLTCRLLKGDLWELARKLPRWRAKW